MNQFYCEDSPAFEKSVESGEESLTIFNESDSNPWNARGYISQLTTPCATPHLSPVSQLSLCSQLWSCPGGEGLPWVSQSAPGRDKGHTHQWPRTSAPPGVHSPRHHRCSVVLLLISVATVYCLPSGATAPPRAAARTGPCTRATAWGWTGWGWRRKRRGSSVTRRRRRAGSWTGARARPP